MVDSINAMSLSQNLTTQVHSPVKNEDQDQDDSREQNDPEDRNEFQVRENPHDQMLSMARPYVQQLVESWLVRI